MLEGLTESDAVKEGLLINIHNGAMKQYYYNVIKELHDIGLGDMSTTEDFYYNIQDCYERMFDVGKCVDELIKIKEMVKWLNLQKGWCV